MTLKIFQASMEKYSNFFTEKESPLLKNYRDGITIVKPQIEREVKDEEKNTSLCIVDE